MLCAASICNQNQIPTIIAPRALVRTAFKPRGGLETAFQKLKRREADVASLRSTHFCRYTSTSPSPQTPSPKNARRESGSAAAPCRPAHLRQRSLPLCCDGRTYQPPHAHDARSPRRAKWPNDCRWKETGDTTASALPLLSSPFRSFD